MRDSTCYLSLNVRLSGCPFFRRKGLRPQGASLRKVQQVGIRHASVCSCSHLSSLPHNNKKNGCGVMFFQVQKIFRLYFSIIYAFMLTGKRRKKNMPRIDRSFEQRAAYLIFFFFLTVSGFWGTLMWHCMCVLKRVHISLLDKGLSFSALRLSETVLVTVCLHTLVFVCAGELSPTSEFKTFPS